VVALLGFYRRRPCPSSTPGLKKLLEDIARKSIDTVVVYKVDRLTPADFSVRSRCSDIQSP
jgi:DNA invertase Pin-like site-specific DNA recombinase